LNNSMQANNQWTLANSHTTLTNQPSDSDSYKARYFSLRERFQFREEEFEELMSSSLQQIQRLEMTLEECLNEIRAIKNLNRNLEEELSFKENEVDQLRVCCSRSDEVVACLEKKLLESRLKFDELICIERQKNETDVHALRKIVQGQQNELAAAKKYCEELEYKVRSLNGKMKRSREINKSSLEEAKYHSSRKIDILVSASKKIGKENFEPVDLKTAVTSRVPTQEVISSRSRLEQSSSHLEPIDLDEELFQYAHRQSFNELCESPSVSFSPRLLRSRMIDRSCLKEVDANWQANFDIELKQIEHTDAVVKSKAPICSIGELKDFRKNETGVKNDIGHQNNCCGEQTIFVPVPSQRDASSLSGFLWFTVKTISVNFGRYMKNKE
jgi:hypothetical protein